MKYIITIVFCLACITGLKAQQYTVSADTSTCRLTVTNPGSKVLYMLLVDDVCYMDIGNELQIFDGISTFRATIGQIVSHASVAALKADIDTWITACRP